ncbi:MAG: hypothetical protein VX899_27675 [Myxococcota bacterium]|nr:hypothetical protein [Myxococcota bacterium]
MKHPALPWLAAALAYVVGACVFAWPLPAHLGDAVWGDRFDAWTTLWLMDHLGAGGGMDTTTEILFPIGYPLWSFGHVAVQMLGLPLMWAGVSTVATYNLLLITSLAGTGLAGHALGRHLGGGHATGAVVGSLFAFSPMLYGEMGAGCLELVAAFPIPLVALAGLRLLEAPGWRRALALTGALVLCGPMNWYYLAFSALMLLGIWGWRATQGGRRMLPGLGWSVGAASLAVALLLPMIHTARQETPTRVALTQADLSAEAADLAQGVVDGTLPLAELTEADLVQADSFQVLVNATTLRGHVEMGFPANPLQSTPGRLAWLVGALSLALAGRRGRPWALLALAFTVLTLGPYPRWDATLPLPAWSQSWPLPYLGLYNHLPFFSKVYRPYRLGIIVVLALGCLGAVAVGRRPKLAWGVPALFLAAITQPHWSGASARPLADTAVSPAYAELAGLPAAGVIELPLHHQPLSRATARQQWAQRTHGMPLLNCNQLIRRDDLWRFRDYVLARPFLEQMLNRPRRDDTLKLDPQDIDALRDEGFGYVVAHRGVPVDPAHLGQHDRQRADRLSEPTWTALERLLGAPVIEAPDGTVVWEIPEKAGEVGILPSWDPVSTPDSVVLSSGQQHVLAGEVISLWIHAADAPVQVVGGPRIEADGTWRFLSLPGPVHLEGSGVVELADVRVRGE